MEQNLDLLRTTNGGEKIPFVMVYSQDGYYINDWTERPYESYKITRNAMQKFNYQKSKEFFEYYIKQIQKNVKDVYKHTASEFSDVLLKCNAIQGSSQRINQKQEG